MRIAFRQLVAALVFVAFLAIQNSASAQSCPSGESYNATTGACELDLTPVSAGGTSPVLVNPIGGTATYPSGVSSVPQLLGNVLRALFGVLGSIALLMFIYGGFLWLTSGGEAEKIKKGKDTMVWAILGIAIIFSSFAIVSFVINRLTAS